LSAVESTLTATPLSSSKSVPSSMKAAVYRGHGRVLVESVETPPIGPGELLIAVHSCGICHTDLKKIEYDLLLPPRIYGHETAGIVAAVGAGVSHFRPGDRVVAFHHVPCRHCFYCDRRLYAQCPTYKKVGITAGFEPAGGGFAQYVRVMDWIVESGVETIPDNVSFDQACWVEPVNTCLKGISLLGIEQGDVLAVLGQGPIGLIFTMLALRKGAKVLTTDTIPFRRRLSERFGALSFDPREPVLERVAKELTQERGLDAVIVATSAPRLVEQAIEIGRRGHLCR
jgi:L-iditol 2-dehydrogenase